MLTRPRSHLAAATGYVALAAADAYLAGRGGPTAKTLRKVTKPLLMPALAAVTRSAAGGRRTALLGATHVAQAFSWGGDVALLGDSRRRFLAGLGSFFAVHVCYLAGFAGRRDAAAGRDHPGARAGLAVWAAAGPALAVAAGRKEHGLGLPVAAYAGVLATMFAASTMLERSVPRSARACVVAGTTLFLASDLLLGVREFVVEDAPAGLDSAVMATYTLGQWLIAEGVAAATTTRI